MANLRHVSGVVGKSGNKIVDNGGFDCSRVGTGKYKVTFRTASKSQPVIVVTAATSEDSAWTAATTIHAAGLKSFTISTQDLNTHQHDAMFNFIAVLTD